MYMFFRKSAMWHVAALVEFCHIDFLTYQLIQNGKIDQKCRIGAWCICRRLWLEGAVGAPY